MLIKALEKPSRTKQQLSRGIDESTMIWETEWVTWSVTKSRQGGGVDRRHWGRGIGGWTGCTTGVDDDGVIKR